MAGIDSIYKLIVVFSLFVLFVTYPPWAISKSDKRFALVIGNSDYRYATTLKNPKNDSSDMAKTLKGLYFETTLIQNATKLQINSAIKKFIIKLKKNGGVGLFYYAGHGVQFEGSNYLIPTETKAGSELEIKSQSFDISNLLNGLRNIAEATNIIILDACRDNPFKNIHPPGIRSSPKSRSVATAGNRSLVRITIPKLDSGLSKLDAPSNTLIAFATAPGKVAIDGQGRNSPYTANLIESLQRSGLTIDEVFRRVRLNVAKQSNGKQIPWESSSMMQRFYFKHRTLLPMGF
ncbi:hypothetical protein MNBD_GAMMA22-1265 [hydrothermal vent metagenome]|uniref:Caspase family p20 domain-containing protein n=1 Tax=hydrothermal vent metagenome TaxID=652676 RepID=A0A3B1A829_9ZZZZ